MTLRTEIQGAFSVLDKLTSGLYYTLEGICLLGSSVPRNAMLEVIEFATTQGILVKFGGRTFLRKRPPIKADMDVMLNAQSPDDPQARLQHAHDGIETLLQDRVNHPWLQIVFSRMPQSTLDALRRQAAENVGAGASDILIETQMLLLAARAIQTAYRSPRDTHDRLRLNP